jgi:hypothetical protein
MNIVIVNHSNSINDADLLKATRALGRQLKEDFTPLWDTAVSLRAISACGSATSPDGKPVDPSIGSSDAIIYLAETKDDPNGVQDALGYHDANFKGVPYGFVFTDLAAQIGESWTVTLSHELLELAADPEVNLLVATAHPTKPDQIALRSFEICDPVQGDIYDIDGIAVSDFVTPLYFASTESPPTTPVDFCGTGIQQFGVNPQGYYAYYDIAAGGWENVYAGRAQARAAVRDKMGMTRRRARHALRNMLTIS